MLTPAFLRMDDGFPTKHGFSIKAMPSGALVLTVNGVRELMVADAAWTESFCLSHLLCEANTQHV